MPARQLSLRPPPPSLTPFLSLILHKLCRHRLQSGKRDMLYAYLALWSAQSRLALCRHRKVDYNFSQARHICVCMCVCERRTTIITETTALPRTWDTFLCSNYTLRSLKLARSGYTYYVEKYVRGSKSRGKSFKYISEIFIIYTLFLKFQHAASLSCRVSACLACSFVPCST